MVEESSTVSSDGNNNLPDSRNNAVSATINNLAQAFVTLQTGTQITSTTSSHAPLLDTFSYMQYFDLSSRVRSTAF